MKKCLSIIFVLAVVSCLLSVCIPSVCAAENDSYYYYTVKVTTKIDGDALSEDLDVYYSLHGVLSDRTNSVLDPYSIDGTPADYAIAHFRPGITEQTNVFAFRWEEPIVGVRLIQEDHSFTGMTFVDDEYYLEFPAQTQQQPGLANAMHIDQLHLIEGFADGGIPILSELRDSLFTLKYNAPPVFSGAEDDGEYFTTQKVLVKDADLVSVKLDGKAVEIKNGEALVTLPGDANKSYTITAEDAVGTCQLTVTMHAFSELTAPVSGINEKNVKVENKATILTTLGNLETVSEQEPNAPAEEKARLNTMKEELKSLLSRIDEALGYINSDHIQKVKDITADNVKLADKEALEKAASDLKKALEEYGGNYNDAEKKALQEDWTRVNGALKVIEEMATESPETGDNNHLTLWLALFMLSGLTLVTTIRKFA